MDEILVKAGRFAGFNVGPRAVSRRCRICKKPGEYAICPRCEEKGE